MAENNFFDALSHIMWNMEVDIFSEKNRTLALLMDFAPRCRKQYSRMKAMYDCGAMELIGQAIENKDRYAELMWEAVDEIAAALNTDEQHAVYAVNMIVALWNGDLPELECDDDVNAENPSEQEGEDVLFLQDVAVEQQDQNQNENQEPEQTSPSPEGEAQSDAGEAGGSGDAGDAGGAEQSGESLIKKIVTFWCSSECEEGRPLMITCPIGWLEILISCIIGVFLIYDVTVGDTLPIPAFIFTFIVLVGKRHYRYDSVGRLSLAMAFFYIAATLRALWVGCGATLRCVPIVIAALIVFNNGRFSVFLDGKKRRPALSYTLIFFMSAAIAAGAYAVQKVEL